MRSGRHPAARAAPARKMSAVSDPVNPPPQTPPPAPTAPYAPPGGYAPPAGYPAGAYAAPYVPMVGYGPAPVAPGPAHRSPALGVVALLLALAAAVVAPIVVAVAAFAVGAGAGREISLRPAAGDFDWSILSPVREWVLLGEISFWAGTVLGVWAIAQGIVAIVKRRGRGQGIGAVVLGALGPIVWGVALQITLTLGLASGASAGIGA